MAHKDCKDFPNSTRTYPFDVVLLGSTDQPYDSGGAEDVEDHMDVEDAEDAEGVEGRGGVGGPEGAEDVAYVVGEEDNPGCRDDHSYTASLSYLGCCVPSGTDGEETGLDKKAIDQDSEGTGLGSEVIALDTLRIVLGAVDTEAIELGSGEIGTLDAQDAMDAMDAMGIVPGAEEAVLGIVGEEDNLGDRKEQADLDHDAGDPYPAMRAGEAED